MLSLKRSATPAGVSLLLILAIAGCGSNATSSTNKAPGVRFNGKASTIELSSQFAGSTIPAAYTCDGHDHFPALSWGSVPAGTKQMVLFILGFTRSGTNTRITVKYALAGLKPSLGGIQAGKIPAGTIPGRGSSGHSKYSLCPPRGSTENYLFLLYAVPNQVTVHKSFNATQLLGKISPSSSPATFGAFLAAYARP